MSELIADARPTKGLFLEMFVRDLSLEDCVLDLVDNSIDSLVRSRNIDVSESLIPATVVSKESSQHETNLEPANIDISFDLDHFQVKDNCGGISVKDAKEEVFRFGHLEGAIEGQLGVYGIGLKRAIFKIGNEISIESRMVDEGFKMVIDVPKWSEDLDWTLPFDTIEGTADQKTAGTLIRIESLRVEIIERLKSGTFESRLKEMIERTYCLFLNRYVDVTLNGHKIEPKAIPLGDSEEVNIAKEEFEENGVKVTMYAGLAGRTEDNEWKQVDAGWYIACNGRLVVTADRDKLTGWGVELPIFVPKYRGFIGLVFFYSRRPLLLPWTTTKQGLNIESLVYQRALTRMTTIARPVLNFLNSMFSSSESEREPQRIAAAGIKSVDITELTERPDIQFIARTIKPEEMAISVQFSVKQKEIDRIKKCLGKYSWSARRIARYTFDHFLKTECPE